MRRSYREAGLIPRPWRSIICRRNSPLPLSTHRPNFFHYAMTNHTNRICQRFLCAAALLFLAAPRAHADSWLPPSKQVVSSADGKARVTVLPREISGALSYFEDKVKGNAKPGQRKGDAQTSPMARVERKGADGKWQPVWQGPLVNDVGPPAVLLADGGTFLVTFDNWHSAGYGDDVVVIYDRHGNLVRKYSLEQLLPKNYVEHVPRSVSSRWWGGHHRLVEHDSQVELQIVEPTDEYVAEPHYVPLRIRLSDGVLIPPQGAAWNSAIAKANQLESDRQAAWDERRRVRIAPLAAPTSNDTDQWRGYMFELRDRIVTGKERMGGMVLAAPGQEQGYPEAENISGWIEDYDANEQWSNKAFIFASPTSDRLADLLVKALLASKNNSMSGAHMVFVGTSAEGQRVTEAGRHTGLEITLVDGTKAFPPGKPLPDSPPSGWFSWP